jgi:hypothetical protein
MNRTFLGILGLLACMAAMTKAQLPGPLTSIEQVCALSNMEAPENCLWISKPP